MSDMEEKDELKSLGLNNIYTVVRNGWKTIVVTAVMSVLVCGLYLVFRDSVYEARVVLGKPLESDILELKKVEFTL
ncbi:hypothetical protein [Zooshikella ganghwensis]|uniref:Uncharacterized protein n=1 Tax=Zooshikella ganghwensis TaxID=202772 RepID=A0A4P9VJ11_9GAMM|nr:hypothetical protein [Zooshikella ganghwensis]RDH43193.1 hypothetical protein B9G39_06935 [Zooshikella ganghwensis]